MTTETNPADVFGNPTPVNAAPAAAQPASAFPAAAPVAGASAPSGLQDIRWGEKRDPSPISQYKGQQGAIDMVGVVGNAQVCYSHFDKGGFGRMFCFQGTCCDKLGMPNVHYIIPVVHYDTYIGQDDKLEFRSKKMKPMYLRLDREKYDFFANIARAGGDPTLFDYVISCSDTKYQKLVFNQVQGRQAFWRQPEIIEAVTAKVASVIKFIEPSLGKTVTEIEFNAKHGIGVHAGPTTNSSNLSELI